jgi:hypothetical protein
LEAEDGGTIGGMTAKQLVREHLPSWSEEQAQRALQAAEDDPEPNGAVEPTDAGEEGPIPTLEESIAMLAGIEFLPREDAWR